MPFSFACGLQMGHSAKQDLELEGSWPNIKVPYQKWELSIGFFMP